MKDKPKRHPVSEGEARRYDASVSKLKERLDKMKSPNDVSLAPGVMEAPENIPENAGGNLKIIME